MVISNIVVFVNIKLKNNILNAVSVSFTGDSSVPKKALLNSAKEGLHCSDIQELLKTKCREHAHSVECLRQKRKDNGFTLEYELRLKQ